MSVITVVSMPLASPRSWMYSMISPSTGVLPVRSPKPSSAPFAPAHP
jgi:hypothetical protein